MIPFGQQFRDHIQMQTDNGYIPINQPSCGSVAKKVFQYHEELTKQMYQNSDKFVFEDQFNLCKEQLKAIEEFLKTSMEQMFLIDTATAGLNAVLKHLQLKKGDKVMITNIEYKLDREIIQHQVKKVGIELIVVEFTKDTLQSPQKMLAKFQEKIKEHPNIRLCMFDHIAPMPCCKLPAKEIIQLCKQNGIVTLVDGFQALGQIDFNLEELEADFYLLTFYKWCFGMIGANVIWMQKKYIADFDPPHISYHQSDEDFYAKYHWQGMRNINAWLCIKEAIKFYQENNPSEMRKYGHDMVVAGSKEIAEIWGTDLLIENEDQIPCMANIRLPIDDEEKANQLLKKFLLENKFHMRIIKFDGHMYGRVSGWAYNVKSDYERLANLYIKGLQGY